MQDKKEKLLALLIGMVVLFISLEAALRVEGYLLWGRSSAEEDGQYNILCLGNSHTRGAFIDQNESYPSQLASMFERRAEEEVKVINKGIVSINSGEILNKLEDFIEETDPDLIILRTGEPNHRNHYYYSNYLKRTEGQRNLIHNPIIPIYDWLYGHLHIFRLATLLKNKVSFEEKGRRYGVEKENTCINNLNSSLIDWYHARLAKIEAEGKDSVSRSKIKNVLNKFERGVENRPKQCRPYPENYKYIAEMHNWLGQQRERVKWLMRGIRADPGFRIEYEMNENYAEILRAKRELGDPFKREIERFIANFTQKHPQYAENLASPSTWKELKWVRSDLEEMIQMIDKKETKLIIHNYHPRPTQENDWLQKLNRVLEETADEFNLTFVDNERIFQRLIANHAKDRYYVKLGGALDSHLNGRGQKVTAEHLYQAIKSKRLLNLTYKGEANG